MKITENNSVVPLSQISPNDFNPKLEIQANATIRQQFKKLKDSLKYHGQTAPILVRELEDKTFEIIDGEHRFFAMQELGFEEAEIKNLGKLTREEAIKKLFSMEIKFEVDPEKEALLLKELQELGAVEGLPFTSEEIDLKIEMLSLEPLPKKNTKQDRELRCPKCGKSFDIQKTD